MAEPISDHIAIANKLLVRRFFEEVINRGDTRLLTELVAADHIRHAGDGDLYGTEGVRIDLAEWRAGFPDLQIKIEDLAAEGDRVASRFVLQGTHTGPFLGLPPTGQGVTATGVAIDRVASGRLAECWVILDSLGLLRQIGGLH